MFFCPKSRGTQHLGSLLRLNFTCYRKSSSSHKHVDGWARANAEMPTLQSAPPVVAAGVARPGNLRT
ncbi:Uncharacterized protein TCM_031080 [Theobroma cacao]|uniref:Uncharacterized protein n=1 Tax=Theobroma cacao TaxID=3641 RepID=A0A061F693_THECC|nr:Uncharacterized protein TCM_031080 [Theobroma cacao]